MGDALEGHGSADGLRICEWGLNEPWDWVPSFGHLWRTTGDIGDNWDEP